MRTSDGGRTWASTRRRSGLPPDERHLQRWRPGARVQRSRPRVLPRAALLLPATAARPRSRSTSRSTTARRGPRVVGRPSPRRTSTRRRATVDDALVQRQGVHRRSTTTPTSPHYGRLYVTYTRFHIAAMTAPATPARSSSSYTDTVPSQDPSLTVWTQHRRRARRSGRGRRGILGEPVLGPGRREERRARRRVRPGGVQHVARPRAAIPEVDERRRELPRQAVNVNKAGQWADNPNACDLIPNTAFRTPNTVALAYSPTTGHARRSSTRTTSAVRGTATSR